MNDVSFCDILCQICNCESKCNFEKQEEGRGRLLLLFYKMTVVLQNEKKIYRFSCMYSLGL